LPSWHPDIVWRLDESLMARCADRATLRKMCRVAERDTIDRMMNQSGRRVVRMAAGVKG